MKFSVQINSSPYHAQAADSAYHFIKAALALGHEVSRVFFYRDGVYNALRHCTPPDDERQVTARWSRLAREHGVDLVVCISAAQRRGLLSSVEAGRPGERNDAVAEGFRISGLGQLAEAAIRSERFVVFGG